MTDGSLSAPPVMPPGLIEPTTWRAESFRLATSAAEVGRPDRAWRPWISDIYLITCGGTATVQVLRVSSSSSCRTLKAAVSSTVRISSASPPARRARVAAVVPRQHLSQPRVPRAGDDRVLARLHLAVLE